MANKKLPPDLPGLRDITERLDQYLLRISAESEGIAIKTLREIHKQIVRAKKASRKHWSIDRIRAEAEVGGRTKGLKRKRTVRENRIQVALESIESRQLLTEVCKAIADELGIPLRPRLERSTLHLMPDIGTLFPIDPKTIQAQLAEVESQV